MAIAIPGGSSPTTPILDAPLDHIDLNKASLQILTGGTSTLVATLKTAGGRTLAGDVDNWVVANSAVCTTLGGGVFEYVADGTTTVWAVKDGIESDHIIATCSNAVHGDEEPEGMTMLYFQPFDEEFPTGWINAGALQSTSAFGNGYGVINDPESPGTGPQAPGEPNVGEFFTQAFVYEGTLTANGTSTTIVLPNDASAVDDIYNGYPVGIFIGGVVSQRCAISDYVGSTRTATVTYNQFDTPPVATFDPAPAIGDDVKIYGMVPGTGSGGRVDASSGLTTAALSFFPTKLYWCCWLKLNEDFQINHNDDLAVGSPVQKFMEGNAQDNYFSNGSAFVHMPEWLNVGSVTDPAGAIQPVAVWINGNYAEGGNPEGSIDGPPGINPVIYQNENLGITLPRGEWVFCQALTCWNSTIGVANGSFQFWITIDDVKYRTHNYPSIQAERPLGFISRFRDFNIQTVYGGLGAPITANNFYYIDDLYVSGGYNVADEEPMYWELTAFPGTTVAAGQDVQVVAQLMDDADRPVNVFGQPANWSATQSAPNVAGPLVPMTFEVEQTAPPSSGGVRLVSTQLELVFSTTTTTPPAAGGIRFNSGTIGSVTHVYVSQHDRNTDDILTSLSSVAGTMRITNESNGSVLQFTVTSSEAGGSGATAYVDYTVHSGSGTIPANAQDVTISATPLTTHVYVSDDDRDSLDMSGLLDILALKGVIRLVRPDTGFATFFIQDISDESGYYDFTVTNGGGDLPSDADDITFSCTLQQGRDCRVVSIPGGLTPGQTVVVTATDHAAVNNAQEGRERTGDITLTVA